MDLATLIETRRRELGLSYEQVAARAARHGHKISGSAVHKYTRSGVLPGFPKPDTLAAIAAGLDVKVDQVVVAAAASVGLQLTTHTIGDDQTQAWLALTANRTPEEVQELLAAVTTLLSTGRTRSDTDS